MAAPGLVIGNKRSSSRSMRPRVLLHGVGIEFEESEHWLDEPCAVPR